MTTSTTKVRPPSWIWDCWRSQVGDRPMHLRGSGVANPVAAVQDPVDGGLAQAGLQGDLSDPERVAHEASLLRGF